jgi:hypothetical protein
MTYHDLFLIAGVPVWLKYNDIFETYTFIVTKPALCEMPTTQAALPIFEWQHYLHHLEKNSSYGSITIVYFKKQKKTK